MDLSQWYKFKPDLIVVATNRKFYNKFVHKVNYEQIYGAFSIPRSQSWNDARQKLKQSRRYNFTDSYLEKLAEVFAVYKNRGDTYRMRFEGATVGIFCNDLNILLDISSRQMPNYKDNISFVSTITDSAQQQALDQNKIILKRFTECTHRVTLRDGYYADYTERHALAQYLKNLNDQVKISKKYLKEIEQGYKYLRSGYFYVQDPRVVDMIRLIMPNIVRSIQEVVVH